MADVKENKQETSGIEQVYTAATVVGAPAATIEERKVEPVAGPVPIPAPFVPR